MSAGKKSANPKKKSCSRGDVTVDDFLKQWYAFSGCRNYENFLLRIGVGNAVRQRALNLKPRLKLTKKRSCYTIVTDYADGGQVGEITFEPEKPVVRATSNGTVVTSVFRVSGNVILETQSSPEDTIVVARKFNRDYVCVTMTCSKVKCERYYKRVAGAGDGQDVTSETSRRRFLGLESTSSSSQYATSPKSTTTETEIEIGNVV